MKTIIAGSRSIIEMKHIETAIVLSNFNITEVVCGMASGVDTLGLQWAKTQKIKVTEFPAFWAQEGKLAGIKRNVRMGNYADVLISIWDGSSKGTDHMIRWMKKIEKPIFVYKPFETNLYEF